MYNIYYVYTYLILLFKIFSLVLSAFWTLMFDDETKDVEISRFPVVLVEDNEVSSGCVILMSFTGLLNSEEATQFLNNKFGIVADFKYVFLPTFIKSLSSK